MNKIAVTITAIIEKMYMICQPQTNLKFLEESSLFSANSFFCD